MDLNSNASRTDYHGKMNFQFLMLLWAHLPISWLTAGLAGQSYVTGTLFSLAILSLPTALVWRNRASVEAAVANGVALVSFSALLIHLSGGMTEMHFHIFSALGLMITLAQPAAIVGAVLLVVVHHVGFFFLLPKSLINYDASFGILVIHAIFALSIGVPAFFISRKFKLYIVSVKGIVDDIQDIAAPLSESSLAMHKNSQTLSTSTKQEAGAVTRTASSLEQLTAMIAKNSDNAADVAKMSELSKQKSSRSLEIVAQVVEALVRIQENSRGVLNTVEQSNTRMKKVVDLIAQIESKTGVINDIVFQTKLLSFNASVEAARAGEHGKGFAVVAEEVGNLARMSGTSAQEISSLLQTSARDVHNLIDQSQREISSIVNDGQAQIHEGMSVAEQCKSMLADIDSGLLEASRIAVEIATASKEQSQGVSEITKAMNDIETASSQTSEVSNHTAETAATLTEGTEKLAQAVNRLINTVQKGAA